MLLLSSTRKIHSEEHRTRLLAEIKRDIYSVLARPSEPDQILEVRRLLDLWEIVAVVSVGKEWLTDQENLRFNEELFQAGVI